MMMCGGGGAAALANAFCGMMTCWPFGSVVSSDVIGLAGVGGGGGAGVTIWRPPC